MAIRTRGLVPRVWRKLKRILIVLFLLHFVYLLILKWMDPPITLTQTASLFRGDGLKRDYVDASSISIHAKLAVLSAEDQAFPDHNGFDWKSIEKALEHNKRKPQKIKGASTISQQVAKNVFLWQGRSWLRKGLETYFTFMIELVWGKRRILEVYLNVIETGRGVFGIEAAAHEYFGKSSAKLTRREAALIAACLPNPKRYTIKPLSRFVAVRHQRILRHMNNLRNDPDIKAVIAL